MILPVKKTCGRLRKGVLTVFCPKCGAELVPGARFCSKCGSEVGLAEPAAGTSGAQTFTVTFTREKQWFAINPAVKIIVDERDEYRIDSGETIRVPMTGGIHGVTFRCGVRNKVIQLEVAGDLSVNLKWNRLTGSLVVK